MLRYSRCPRCSKRSAAESTRCHACGAELERVLRGEKRIGGVGALALLVGLVVTVLLAITLSHRYVPAVSDWYSRMVIQYMPDQVFRFAPLTDEERAFYVCARSVAKRMNGESSVETFASSDAASMRQVAEGRYVIESHVEESVSPGVSRRHVFTCVVRAEGEDWVLEELELRATAERDPAELVTTAP